MIELGDCKKLSARITQLQCDRNRGRIITCIGCAGLGAFEQVSLPNREEVKVITNKKKYICITPGCEKQQAKNKLCYSCNKAAEAEKHGSFIPETKPEVVQVAADPAPEDFTGKVIEREAATVQENAHIDAGWEPAASPKATGLAALLRLSFPPPRARRAADPLHQRRNHHADRIRHHAGAYPRIHPHGPGRQARAIRRYGSPGEEPRPCSCLSARSTRPIRDGLSIRRSLSRP